MVIKFVFYYTVFEELPPVVQPDNQKCTSVGPSSPALDVPTPSDPTDTSDHHHVRSSSDHTWRVTPQTMETQSEVMFQQSRKGQLGGSLCNLSVNA
jgi:hypothetical protein